MIPNSLVTFIITQKFSPTVAGWCNIDFVNIIKLTVVIFNDEVIVFKHDSLLNQRHFLALLVMFTKDWSFFIADDLTNIDCL